MAFDTADTTVLRDGLDDRIASYCASWDLSAADCSNLRIAADGLFAGCMLILVERRVLVVRKVVELPCPHEGDTYRHAGYPVVRETRVTIGISDGTLRIHPAAATPAYGFLCGATWIDDRKQILKRSDLVALHETCHPAPVVRFSNLAQRRESAAEYMLYTQQNASAYMDAHCSSEQMAFMKRMLLKRC